jgi:hypothetical protein
MKYVKMLGLAAVSAAALMAFVGAGTASATVLCKTPGTGTTTGTTCPEGWAYSSATLHAVLDPETGPAKLVTSFKNIECKQSTVSITQTNEGSATETVKGTVEEHEFEPGKFTPWLTFGECNCEVKVLSGGSVEVHWIEGSHNGTITSTGGEVTAQCNSIFGPVHCIYQTNKTDIGKLTGGAMATMDIEKSNIPRLATDALCAEKAEWSAKYTVTEPEPLYVTGHT